MRLLTGLLLLLLILLQYRLWVGPGSLAEVNNLQHEIDSLRRELVDLRDRNSALQAEVRDLRTGRAAIEERARSELGMIKEGEVFYQVIQPAESSVDE